MLLHRTCKRLFGSLLKSIFRNLPSQSFKFITKNLIVNGRNCAHVQKYMDNNDMYETTFWLSINICYNDNKLLNQLHIVRQELLPSLKLDALNFLITQLYNRTNIQLYQACYSNSLLYKSNIKFLLNDGFYPSKF